MRKVETITARLENIDVVRPAASSSPNAGPTSNATPRPGIASNPRTSNAQISAANTTRSALLARTSSRVTARTFTRESFSPASRTRPSSPRFKTELKWSSLKVHICSRVGRRRSFNRGGLGKHNRSFACSLFPPIFVPNNPHSLRHEAEQLFVSSQSLQRLVREDGNSVKLA